MKVNIKMMIPDVSNIHEVNNVLEISVKDSPDVIIQKRWLTEHIDIYQEG